MKYARIEENVVVNLLIPPDGFTVEECFHPDVLAGIEPVGQEVQHGWIKQEDGSFAAPAEQTTTDTTE